MYGNYPPIPNQGETTLSQERTLVIIKPDGIQRGLTGEIISRLERRGLKIIAARMMQVGKELASRHYAMHEGKPFYPGLIDYIASSPVLALVLEGRNAIQLVRNTVGATNPLNAAPGTIRGDLAVETGRNLIHASDSPENGEKEIALFFQDRELVDLDRSIDPWIYE
jgi:nucleoside-diphosphate kinase